MKKFIVSLVAITVASNAIAACSGNQNGSCKPKKVRIIHITANNAGEMYGNNTVAINEDTRTEPVYRTTEPETTYVNTNDSAFYIGARLDLNLLNFKTKYFATPTGAIADPSADHDDYRFEPVFGGNAFFGRNFSKSWRGDLELGYITKFTDSDEGITLGLSAPYFMGNVYYTFDGGVYLGAGVGIAMPRVSMDWSYFSAGDSSETKLSFMGAGMLGYNYRLSENVVLDLRYRLAAFDGPSLKREVEGYTPVGLEPLEKLETDVKTVWDNSFSIGVRYEF